MAKCHVIDEIGGLHFKASPPVCPSMKAGDRAGDPFKRPPRGPITKQHMRALRRSLDLWTGRGAAIWSAATPCFSACRRLGELLVVSTARFCLQHDTCRETRTSRGVVNGHQVITFHITQTSVPYGPSSTIWRLTIPRLPTTPLFAFREDGRWHTPTKAQFFTYTSSVYVAAGLETVYGHSYRIGG
ncbi:hypothetical protein B0H14DRAFT_3603196 [Mycena olivaceomarginata]|nr:hypothetical protein B0H14DRAFT_3603196 [Mycena olivaceomarginata]